MITAGDELTSLSQIAKALKAGFAVRAVRCYYDPLETRDVYAASSVDVDIITKLTDLHVSAYNQLVGIVLGPCDHLDDEMNYSPWEFMVIER